MSTRWAPLTLKKLLKALADVSDWRTLGINLDVNYATLDKIERDYPKSVHQMSQMLYTWLSGNTAATWEHIVTALREMNLNSIAKNIEAEYRYSTQEQKFQMEQSGASPPTSATLLVHTTPPPTTEGTLTSMDTDDSEEDRLQVVEEEIHDLEIKFQSLVLNAEEFFTDRVDQCPRFLSKIRVSLVHLPASQKPKHLRFFEKNETRILEARSVEALILILGRYWNWWNYSLLQHIIDSFGNQELKDQLHCYLKDLEEFERNTVVEDFIRACHSYLGVPPEFTEVRTRMQGNWTRYTVYQIRMLARKLARSSPLETPFVGMSHSSIVLIWAVPSTAVRVLAAAINEEFLQSNEIESVTIDGKDLSSYQSQDGQSETPSKPVGGWTPLIWACANGHVDIVHVLVEAHADLNAHNQVGWTPLSLASANGHTEIVRALLMAGVEVDTQPESGRTALMKASRTGHSSIVRELLDGGAGVNIQDKSGKTALFHACWWGKTEVVRELLQRQADVNIPTEEGLTPLIAATREGYGEVVELLLSSRKVDTEIQEQEIGWTALLIAANDGNINLVRLLLQYGANPRVVDEYSGMTALMYASFRGHSSTGRELLDGGAGVNIQDKSGTTALTYARQRGHQAVVDILKASGAVNPESGKEGTRQPRSKRRTCRKQTTQRSHSASDVPVRHAYSLTDLTAKPKALSDSSVSSGDEHHSPPRYWSAAEHSAGSSAGSTCSLGGRYSPTPQVRTKRKSASRRKRFGYSAPPSPSLY